MEKPGLDLEALLKRLDDQRDSYLENHNLVRLLLAAAKDKDLQSTQPPQLPPSPPSSDPKRHTLSSTSGMDSLLTSSLSKATADESESEQDEEEYYVQTPLKTEEYDHEGLRQHLRSYKWTSDGHKVLEDVLSDIKLLSQPTLFPTQRGPVPDRSHLSHYQVFDVGLDGAPLPIEFSETEKPPSNALCIWQAIKDINSPSKERKAVGRITILRELSPMLFGAIHYTNINDFDVDELFKHLVEPESTFAKLHQIYDTDERHRRTFEFNFEYFTIIGDDCQPMSWQYADRQGDRNAHHIPITRCSSVVALSLGGNPIKKVKNRSRRAKSSYGYVYDPFAPWKLLNLQCYPDWKSSLTVHDSTKHYVNGVEAFMVTILGEFRDAHGRFEAIFNRVSKLVTPPLDFMFDADVRERLLFEDSDFTFTRRYFWAAQTLGIVNDSIRAMIDTYEDNFTDEVWSGTHKTLWPLEEESSGRNVFFKKKMAVLRRKFDVEIRKLRNLVSEIDSRRKEIKGLREELYVGTSIQESRKSVENSDISVQQGHNIKLLTLVSIFFLPLTFVTSVFGMTNMPTEPIYWPFAVVTVTVCVPFFFLVGSLNSTRGMRFWRNKTNAAFHAISEFFSCFRARGRGKELDDATLRRRESTGDDRSMRLRGRHASSLFSNTFTESRASGEIDSTDANRNNRHRSTSRGGSRIVGMVMHDIERRRTIRYGPDVLRDVP
ncbi:hypothetical protein VP1G_00104 [Cytospora mali]|uniref:Magnesium transport protein CorA n=1 Tax=Cytospora mali TaxID=578113 RepID=A0A194UM43_CYTMA|nr:hypothetical protein VP1G_00104 [Valsa mali var. pyri (nom. inval.)]